jgi:hypothetical protein
VRLIALDGSLDGRSALPPVIRLISQITIAAAIAIIATCIAAITKVSAAANLRVPAGFSIIHTAFGGLLLFTPILSRDRPALLQALSPRTNI